MRDKFHSCNTKFICIENFTQIFKCIDVITFIYAYRIAFFLITKSSTNRIFIYLVFMVNIYLKFCFINVIKFHSFENYSLIFTPFLFSHIFSFPPPLLPLFPFYLVIWWQIFTNLWKYFNFLEDFLDFCKCNKSFDFDLCNSFWIMKQPWVTL
jgi:hypothetical protein